MSSAENHLTPAQQIGRVIGDIDCAMAEVNPQHHVWRVLKAAQGELLQIKERLGAPETECKPENCERLRDCEISLGTFDPGAVSEYWLKYGSTALKTGGDVS